jgi:phosphatidylinositol alpha-mannosyltransferase
LRSDRPVIFFCGLLRRYKGIEPACDAAQRLGDRVQFVVAGRPKPSGDRSYWQEMVNKVPGAVLIDRGLDDQEFADLIAASDVVLQSYTRITGSGLLLAAWTFGTGVVASDLPFFREMLGDHPDAGLLFPSGDGAAMAERIMEYLAIPEERRRAGVEAAAAAHSWDRCIEPVAQVFDEWRRSAQ